MSSHDALDLEQEKTRKITSTSPCVMGMATSLVRPLPQMSHMYLDLPTIANFLPDWAGLMDEQAEMWHSWKIWV